MRSIENSELVEVESDVETEDVTETRPSIATVDFVGTDVTDV